MSRLEYYDPDYNYDYVDPEWLKPDFDWSKFHTKQLLEMRIAYNGHSALYNIIKKVLSNRPHIPNKVESKIIRQKKAKSQRNR